MEQTEADLQADKPVLNIIGDKVALGPRHKGMLTAFVRWNNDFAVALLSGDSLRPVSPDRVEANLEQLSKEQGNDTVDRKSVV